MPETRAFYVCGCPNIGHVQVVPATQQPAPYDADRSTSSPLPTDEASIRAEIQAAGLSADEEELFPLIYGDRNEYGIHCPARDYASCI